jgi:hypothetical protein
LILCTLVVYTALEQVSKLKDLRIAVLLSELPECHDGEDELVVWIRDHAIGRSAICEGKKMRDEEKEEAARLYGPRSLFAAGCR